MKATIGKRNNAKSLKVAISIGKKLGNVQKEEGQLVPDLVFALRTEKEKTNVDFVSGNIYTVLTLQNFNAVSILPYRYR